MAAGLQESFQAAAVAWVVALSQAWTPSRERMRPVEGMFDCGAPQCEVGRTLKKAMKIQGHGKVGQVGRRSYQMSPGVWDVCAWAFPSENGSTHRHSKDVGSRLW